MSVHRPASDRFVPRIGYVVKRFPRLSETFIVNEVLALERRGLAIEIFSLKEPRSEPRHDDLLRALRAPVTYLSPPDPERPRAGDEGGEARLRRRAAALARFATERGLTHLHAHFGNSATRATMLASRMSGTPYSFTAHARDIFDAGVETAALAEKVRGARFVVTVSDHNQGYLARRLGPALARRVVRLYNGLDMERFAPAPAHVRDPFFVLAAGRLVEKKGLAVLVRACARLRGQGIPLRCVIVGDGPERGRLRAEIEALGLSSTITLAGAQPQAFLLAEMRRAAVFALPCVVSATGDRDGLPTVLLEALAVGLPAVSTTLPGIDEIITDRMTGLLVPPDDPEALAAAVGELLARPGLRHAIAVAGRRRALERFDVTTTSRALHDLLTHGATRPQRAHGGSLRA